MVGELRKAVTGAGKVRDDDASMKSVRRVPLDQEAIRGKPVSAEPGEPGGSRMEDIAAARAWGKSGKGVLPGCSECIVNEGQLEVRISWRGLNEWSCAQVMTSSRWRQTRTTQPGGRRSPFLIYSM